LISLTQQQDKAICILRRNEEKEETINTKFVIGADGAHSIVREKLNIPFEGKTYQQTLFVLDCKAEIDLPNDEMYLTFAGTSFGGFFPLTNGRWRILGNLPGDLVDKEKITFEDIAETFAQRVKMQVRLFDPHWLSVYHSHHRYASTFRQGCGFLVGDAAHIHSPVGAQGMNTGLQDAYNLSWKLALVLKEKAKDKLLDTYTEERIIIARNLVRTTDRVFNLLTNAKASIKLFRMHILPYVLRLGGPVFQKIRFLQKFAFIRVSEIGIHYRFSSISQNASFGSFSKQAPRPGDRLPFEVFVEALGTISIFRT
jgi:2-polyprenyl-6-methoxyphenol hydroxylase-like FAD-dependent oxidoreductase